MQPNKHWCAHVLTRRVGVSQRTMMGQSEASWEERGALSAVGGAKEGKETVGVLFRSGVDGSCRRGLNKEEMKLV